MKIDWNRRTNTVAVYAFLVLTASACTVLALVRLPSLANTCRNLISAIYPAVWGIAIGYVLNRPVRFFRRRVFARLGSPSRPRIALINGCSILAVYLLFFAGFIGMVVVLLPHIIQSLQAFAQQLPDYFAELDTWLQSLYAVLPENMVGSADFSLQSLLYRFSEKLNVLLPALAQAGIGLISNIIRYATDILLAIAVSIYALLSKDTLVAQCKKGIYALFPKRFAENTITLTRESNEIFSAYIVNILLESLLIGGLHLIVLSIFRIPYAPLISVLIGLTDLIPYIGPVIGAGIGILLLFVVSPGYALTLLVITICIQQLEAHILAPRILGKSTGLTKFWVVFALLLGNGLFGFVGTILGIPLFAVLYSVVRQLIHTRLRRQGLSVRTQDYRSEIPL